MEEARISKTVYHEILTEDFGMHHVAAKFVPCLLSVDQIQNYVDVSKELVDSADADENFLKNVTGDETMKLKQKPSLCSGSQKCHPGPKKTHQVRSNVKVMLSTFFDCEGIIHHEFLPRFQTVNKDYYLKVMKRLREAVRRKGPDL